MRAVMSQIACRRERITDVPPIIGLGALDSHKLRENLKAGAGQTKFKKKNYMELENNVTSIVDQKKQRLNTLDPVTLIATRYFERLANFLDTKAWVEVRLSINGNLDDTKKHLDEAYYILSEEALQFSTQLAIIYYHLARICTYKIEILWQSLLVEKPSKKRLHQILKLTLVNYFAYLHYIYAMREG